MLDLIPQRRAKPGTDLVSTLVTAKIDGSHLEDVQVISEALLLWIGGDETRST